MVQVRRQLAAGRPRPAVPRPPALATSASIGVDAVLWRMRASCLESALVRQRWMASHGVMRDVVIGLPNQDFGGTPAHAWLDGTDPEATDGLVELHRYPASCD